MSEPILTFRETAFHLTKQIPVGQVATYGQIATLAGNPRAARQVGWAMASAPQDGSVPWWRVVNRHGYLSIRNDDLSAKFHQKELLLAEGIEVDEEFMLDLSKYRWQAANRQG